MSADPPSYPTDTESAPPDPPSQRAPEERQQSGPNWNRTKGTLEEVAAAAFWAARHVERLEKKLGNAAIPEDGVESRGIYKLFGTGIAEIKRKLADQDEAMNLMKNEQKKRDDLMTEKLDKVLARDAATDALRERRGKTVADIALSTTKAAVIAFGGAVVGFLVLHFKW